MTDKKKRVGILGGTFNPIHLGHLFLAEAAYDRFRLDTVLIMPSLDPPHKNKSDIASLEDRCNMVCAAIEDNDHLEFSDFELKSPGINYTSKTLRKIHEVYPDWEIFFIIGGDSLFSIESWKDPETIFSLATILTGKREEESLGARGTCKPSDANRNYMASRDDRDNDLDEEMNEQIAYLEQKYEARIYNLYVPSIEISSSEIVNRIRAGKSVKYYTPDSVLAYIKTHGLYREDEHGARNL